jgi:hypothetical protein
MTETIMQHDPNNLVDTAGVDSLCGRYNYCQLGVLYAKPFPYTNMSPVSTCALNDIFDPAKTIVNWEYLQRLYGYNKAYYLLDPIMFTSELCVSPCQIFNICVNNNYYTDIVTNFLI